MATLYVTEQGSIVRRVDERIVVEAEKTVLLDVPLIKIDQVVLFGRVALTTPVVALFLERGIEVVYLSRGGRFLGRLQSAFGKNCLVRVDQYRAAFDPVKTLYLARCFVLGKLRNQLVNLQRAVRRGSEIPERTVEEVKAAVRGAERADNLDALRGWEGAGAAAYFGAFGRLLKKEGFHFPGRVRRPPTDPVNSLLSFAYTLLVNDVTAAVNTVGLDPYTGFLHRDHYGRASLALDLAEEFRPVVADAVVLSCLNRGVLAVGDFTPELGRVVRLSEKARGKFLTQYEQKKLTEIRHPVFGYTVTYRQCLELQARLLAKYLQGEIERYEPLIIR